VKRNLVSFDTKAQLPVLLALLYYSHITLLGIKNPDIVLERRLVVPDSFKYWLYLKAQWYVLTLRFRTEV